MNKTKKKTYKFVPQEWQKDPNRLVTETVQYWVNGIMLTAMMSLEEARRLVREGKAYVISPRAIGALESPDGEED
jgi:hypothetical protein